MSMYVLMIVKYFAVEIGRRSMVLSLTRIIEKYVIPKSSYIIYTHIQIYVRGTNWERDVKLSPGD